MAENFGTSSRVVSITVRGGTPQTNQPDLLGLTAGDEDWHCSGDEGDEHGPDGDEHHGLGAPTSPSRRIPVSLPSR